jgi:hypothetical protein
MHCPETKEISSNFGHKDFVEESFLAIQLILFFFIHLKTRSNLLFDLNFQAFGNVYQ